MLDLIKSILNDEDYSQIANHSIHKSYICSRINECTNFTMLMRVALLTKKYPDLNEVIKTYLVNNPEELVKTNKKGWTILHLTSRNASNLSSVETVKIILEFAKQSLSWYTDFVNAKNIANETALCYAVGNCSVDSNIETVQLLLENGANPNDGISLYSACNYSISNKNKAVKLLLEFGADPNILYNGNTILYYTCNFLSCSKLDIVTTLLENGADPNILNNGKFTTLYHVCTNIFTRTMDCQTIDLVKLLIKFKADPNIKFENNEILYYVIKKMNETIFYDIKEKYKQIAQFLIENGAIPNSYDKYIPANYVDIFKILNTSIGIKVLNCKTNLVEIYKDNIDNVIQKLALENTFTKETPISYKIYEKPPHSYIFTYKPVKKYVIVKNNV